MKFNTASYNNLLAIMSIIHEAQVFLAILGIDQWQDGYPDENQIQTDIANGNCYVVLNEANDVLGTTMFTINPESTYNFIEGKWLTDQQFVYGVIHRMAVGKKFRKLGIARFMMDRCEQLLRDDGIGSMKIDTHSENKAMQGMLKNIGYKYCGVIYLENGDQRLAFEKRI